MTSAAEASKRATSRLLAGRREELARLEAAYAGVRTHHRLETVLVEGPAGIGKTRVVQELAARVRRLGGEVLVGACVAQGEEILPYAPLVELLADLVRRDGARAVLHAAGPAGSELTRLLPALAEHGSAPETTRGSSSLLFQAICSLLDTVGRRRPLVIVVEDLHWADRSTREMLSLLAHQLRGDILLVLTVRTDQSPLDPGIVRLTAELGRRAAHRVTLEPLSRDEQAHQISDILGVPPRRDLLDGVYARAEGNPFFAEELLAMGGAGDLPVTIRDLLLARLDALAPATRQVLRAASAVGRTVPHQLLEAVCDLSGTQLEDTLRPAVDSHVLVTDATGGAYQFRHALLQEAVAGSLLPGEVTRMNRRLAEALTAAPELAGTGAFVAGRVARHWYAAGDLPRALVGSVEAAREAKQTLAFSESLAHYERAISLLDTVPDAEDLLDEPRYWLLWGAAEVAHLAAHPGRAADLVRQAIAAVEPSARHHHGYLYERLGRYLWMAADGQGALAAYETAVRLVPAEPPTRWRAAVLSGYAQILMLSSRYAESELLAREAIAIAQQVPDGRSVEGHARCNLGADLGRLGRLDEGVAELLEARRIAEEQFDDVDDIARAMVNLQSTYFDAGRLEESAAVAVDSVGIVEKLGLQRRKGVWCRCDAAQALTLLGRHDQARRLLEEAFDLLPQGVDAVRTDIAYGQLLLRLGRLDTAQEHLERARRAGGRLLDGQLIGPLYTGLVELATAREDLDAAAALAREGRARLPATEDAVHCVPLFAAAAAAQAEHRLRARGRSRGAVGLPDQWVARCEAAIERSPGEARIAVAHLVTARCELARSRGEHDAGAWGAAATRWRELAEPYRAAYALLRTAEAWLAAGDRAEAEGALRTAWSTADPIGAEGLRGRAEQLARRARFRLGPAGDPGTPFGLTAREREVLALVAEGLPDREIGALLFISHRTVERHVSNLLAKLAAGRRSELTAMAHRLGLVTESTG
jgi:DNA-binding CsgD family transcriptional regulator/tetratricopeptide (TPR) repeat protein